jgi:hypothetical protein
MLRTFGIEATAFARRAAHDELAGRDSNHGRTIPALLEFPLGMFVRVSGTGSEKPNEREDDRTTKRDEV